MICLRLGQCIISLVQSNENHQEASDYILFYIGYLGRRQFFSEYLLRKGSVYVSLMLKEFCIKLGKFSIVIIQLTNPKKITSYFLEDNKNSLGWRLVL